MLPSEYRGKTEPRIWTRPLRELTPETSLGFEVCEFVTEVLGEDLLPWQRWFLIHSLELAPGSTTADEYPRLRFQKVFLLVSRQQGKSYIMSRRGLWRMCMWDQPEIDAPLVLGVAHKLDAAEEILSLATKALERAPALRGVFNPPRVGRVSKVNGDKYTEIANGARWKTSAANDDGGRSLSVTDLLFDELRQQRDWSAWMAISETTNAKFSSQTIGVSNAGGTRSPVLKALRKSAIAEVDSPDTTTAIFEWSAPEGCEIDDWDAIAQAVPSLNIPTSTGYPLATSEAIEAKIRLVKGVGIDPDDRIPEPKYRAETLCQFEEVGLSSPFEPGSWDAAADPPEIDPETGAVLREGSRIAPDSRIGVGVDTSGDRRWSWVAVAGRRADGAAHVEVIHRRGGQRWLAGFLDAMTSTGPAAERIVGVAWQRTGAPISEYGDDIAAALGDDLAKPLAGPDLAAVFGQMYDGLRDGEVKHRGVGNPPLQAAGESAVIKRSGVVSWIDRDKSPIDASPLAAAGAALVALLASERAEPEPIESAYETHRLGVV